MIRTLLFSDWSRHRVGLLLLVALALTVNVLTPAPAVAAAGQIKEVAPTAARRGEQVTIKGNGFGAKNVRITVGGVPAQVLTATGNQATFVVPPAALPGLTQVTATNPGGHAGSIGFRVLEGILLPGNATAPAIDAIFDLPPVGVDVTHIEDGVIMSRLDVFLARDATVGQINAALQSIAGGVVSMMPGTLIVTIAVPRQSTVQGLQGLIATLTGAPGIRRALFARTPTPAVLPFGQVDSLSHLLSTGFPAAWNARKLLDGCTPVPVLIPDSYAVPPPGFPAAVPGFGLVMPGMSGLVDDPTHGYYVATVLAGLFDATPPTGAHPFTQCLDLRPIQIGDISIGEAISRVAGAFPAGKFVTNQSFGFSDGCIGPCDPATVTSQLLDAPARADYAVEWTAATQGRWNDFVLAVSAGNEGDGPATLIYPGVGRADFSTEAAIARLPDLLFTWVTDAELWSPTAGLEVFPSLAGSSLDATLLQLEIVARGLDAVLPAENILVAGSVNRQLADSPFSDAGADVKAVAEAVCVDSSCTVPVSGTSFAAPQVAGLAAYLWNLSPTLRGRPAMETVRAIRANARTGIIDAYATILSLDAAAVPDAANAPIRKAILDVNDDGRFDHVDLAEFVARYFDGTTGELLEPSSANHGRFDLNGDGFTGGSRTDRFDLDRVGSTQFGPTSYGAVTQTIEGAAVTFTETSLTDLHVLCYYAYSSLYEGDVTERRELLAGKCSDVTVTVVPAAVTLSPGEFQQFAAIVTGAAISDVMWTGASPTGVFTAGNTPGTFTVRATSIADPSKFDEATVTVVAQVPEVPVLAGHVTFRHELNRVNFTQNTFVTFDVTGQGVQFSGTGTYTRTLTFDCATEQGVGTVTVHRHSDQLVSAGISTPGVEFTGFTTVWFGTETADGGDCGGGTVTEETGWIHTMFGRTLSNGIDFNDTSFTPLGGLFVSTGALMPE